MTTSEPSGVSPLSEAFLSDRDAANGIVELPGGRRVRFEWSWDAPEIDATISMDDEMTGDGLRATSAFDG